MTYFPMSVHLSHLLVLHYDFFDQHKLDILGYPSANNKNDHQELLNKYEDNFAVELVWFNSLLQMQSNRGAL